jgi:hypothetical protein
MYKALGSKLSTTKTKGEEKKRETGSLRGRNPGEKQ